jgi:transcriptional regulator with XRE-family HTH domain
MTEVYRNIAWKLMNLRQGEGLTQEQLALKIGLSKYQLKRVERGLGEITLENLKILADHFEIPFEELFCKTPKTDIEIKLRSEHFEKSQNNLIIKNYSKTFGNTARIRSLEIPGKCIRKMKIEKNLCYDIYALEGALIVRTSDDSQEIDKARILSIKGSGTLKLVNMNSKSATVLTIAY